jgi:hypothetical protein
MHGKKIEDATTEFTEPHCISCCVCVKRMSMCRVSCNSARRQVTGADLRIIFHPITVWIDRDAEIQAKLCNSTQQGRREIDMHWGMFEPTIEPVIQNSVTTAPHRLEVQWQTFKETKKALSARHWINAQLSINQWFKRETKTLLSRTIVENACTSLQIISKRRKIIIAINFKI